MEIVDVDGSGKSAGELQEMGVEADGDLHAGHIVGYDW